MKTYKYDNKKVTKKFWLERLKKYDKNEYEDKNKIIKSLMSKGYNYQLIKKLFE